MTAATMSMEGHPVHVVELGDGRLGFAAGRARSPADGEDVVLVAEDRRMSGPARVVRSGPAYEEVRGRLRADAGWWRRWQLRRDVPIVLVSADVS